MQSPTSQIQNPQNLKSKIQSWESRPRIQAPKSKVPSLKFQNPKSSVHQGLWILDSPQSKAPLRNCTHIHAFSAFRTSDAFAVLCITCLSYSSCLRALMQESRNTRKNNWKLKSFVLFLPSCTDAGEQKYRKQKKTEMNDLCIIPVLMTWCRRAEVFKKKQWCVPSSTSGHVGGANPFMRI